MVNKFRKIPLAGVLTLAMLAACSHAQKKSTPELSSLNGKKVALVDVQGEPTERSVIEVALVNQLIRTGSFILVPKEDVEKARTAVDINPTDWKSVARRAGADFALRANVLEFKADTNQGYSEEQVEDSQLEAETGDAKTQRLYKVKSLKGNVKVQLEFTDLQDPKNTRAAIAEAQDEVTSEGKTEAVHLPPKMRFLENLANKAFRDFFDRYN